MFLLLRPILQVPCFSPILFNASSISSLEIFSFPTISIFQINELNTMQEIIHINISKYTIFLFLYLNTLKYKPFLSIIFTLHFVFLAIFFNFLKSFIHMLNLTIPITIFFIFHILILLILQRFINLSVKKPWISTSRTPFNLLIPSSKSIVYLIEYSIFVIFPIIKTSKSEISCISRLFPIIITNMFSSLIFI